MRAMEKIGRIRREHGPAGFNSFGIHGRLRVSTYGGCSCKHPSTFDAVSKCIGHKHPQGVIADRILAVGEKRVCTSIIVEAELRYGAAKILGTTYGPA